MIPVFADTYYYLALLNHDDQAHDRAVEITVPLDAPVITNTWVLTEVADAAAAARRRSSFIALYRAIAANPDVSILPPSMEIFQQGVELYNRHQDKDWSLTDCISFMVMRKFEVRDALTGDRHFEQAGFRALLK
jgi:predicted nucleic acid-binding protein